MNKKKLIVLAGPTGVGKTGVAVKLANRWETEIISADSRQIFKEMEIGTARPTREEQSEAPHHFVASHSIHAPYTAGQFGRDAIQVVHRIFATHDRAILCGGSGLYIRAVCEGLDDMPEVPAAIREAITKEYTQKGLEWLRQEVLKNDPQNFAVLDQNNPRRLARALELFRTTGNPMAEWRRNTKTTHSFEIVKIGLQMDRALLYERIDRRVDDMVAAGLVDEARNLFPDRAVNALQTVGYTELFDYFSGQTDLADAIRCIKKNTRNYAKRQMTWFTRDPEMHWFRPDQYDELVQFCENA